MTSVAAMLRKSEGEYFCISTKSKSSGKWRDKFFKRRQMSQMAEYINRERKRANIYMCPHGFRRPHRDKRYAVDPHLLYADLDECDPRSIELKPTIAIESSPGRYVGYWLTDKPASEELNRRLTYHIGADNSGWDRTQVLRAPQTKNYKYKPAPTVKVLWSDGPRYEVKRLEKVIPQLQDDQGKESSGDAAAIFKKYEKDLPHWARKEFINPKVQQGKRSEVLWKLINECLEAGMTEDEVFTICWHNAWNKHAERRGGERQLQREIDKATNQHIGGERKTTNKEKKKKRDEDPTKKRFEIVTMDQVTEEEVDWIVKRMLARGQTTIFEGDPGVGKSYFLMWMCTHLCDGKYLPWDKEFKTKPLKVIYCDMENAAGAVTKVRLNDNGLKNQQNYAQFTQPFSVDDPETMEAFEEDVLKVFRPDIVVIDPVNLYIGGADTYRASETQQALQVLKSLSEKYQFALAIVRHLNKSSSGKALYAGNGSIAFAGVARVIATIGWHPEEPDTRVVACTKSNLSTFFGSFGYTIESLPNMKNQDRSRLVYEGHVDYIADDIVSTSNKKDDNTLDIAKDLIREMMGDGDKINYHKVLNQAEGRSISESSIRKAATALGLKKVSSGAGSSRRTFLKPA